MNKNFVDYFIILVLMVLQLTFFSKFILLIFINLPLLYILLRLAFNYQPTIWWLVIFTGLLNDIYSLHFFGTYLILYLVVAWFSYIILYYFFTNRTLFSLTIGIIISLLVFKFSQLILTYFISSFSISILWAYMQKLFFSISVEVIFLFVFIIITNLLFRKKYV